jgi:hypothetical protein
MSLSFFGPDVGKKDKLLKFFKLVQDGEFPLINIAFELFLDIVELFDKDESRQMRYSPSTKGGLTLILYKKPFRYRLPVSPPRKRTKTSSSTPNLKSPSIRTPSLLKKSLFNFKIFISFQKGK